MNQDLQPRLSPAEATAAMAEIKPPLTDQEASVEAGRCLYCFDAPCIMACPTGIDVPGFIQKIASKNSTGAARTILSANILGNSCARVCPTKVLCEGACVLHDRDKKPIEIGRLQRYATDPVLSDGLQVVQVPAEKSGKHVALVGGGPASLGCAAELVRLGHEAVIYERKPNAGGLNTYGIAYYKMKPEISLAEIEMIQQLGVQFKTGIDIGQDVTLDELQSSYDAVFIGVGLGAARQLGIPGEDLPEVVSAIDFIEQIHTDELADVRVGRRVAVLGCGNTAIDAVSQSKRLGAAEAIILYRRGEADMSAYEFEYELAKSERCEFMFNVSPVAIEAADGHVSGVRLVRTDANAKPIPGSEFVEPFDMVIQALGQTKMADTLKTWLPNLELDAGGRIVVDDSQCTSVNGVYAGGDAANGGMEVVNAVADGKRAALHMHKTFTGNTVKPPVQTTRYGAESPRGSGFDQPIRCKG